MNNPEVIEHSIETQPKYTPKGEWARLGRYSIGIPYVYTLATYLTIEDAHMPLIIEFQVKTMFGGAGVYCLSRALDDLKEKYF